MNEISAAGAGSVKSARCGSLANGAPLPERAWISPADPAEAVMIRKLKSGEYRLYSLKTNPKTGKRRNLGTFKTRAEAEKHERAVHFFKRQA
jgi:hypothetical protein